MAKPKQPKRHRATRAPAKGIDELTMMLAVAAEFREAVVVLEGALGARGLNWRDASPPANGGLSEHHMWAGAKAVAHFNLHQAIESIFKLMLALERTRVPSHHNLSDLFAKLSPQTKRGFNAIYDNVVKPQAGVIRYVRVPPRQGSP